MYGNNQQSIEAEATAKKKLEIGAKDLKSNKLATVEPWRTSLPDGVDAIWLDDSVLSDQLKAASMAKFTCDHHYLNNRFSRHFKEHGVRKIVKDAEGNPHYFQIVRGDDGEAEEVEYIPPDWVSQDFIGLDNYISMCIAQLAAPAAKRGAAAMLGTDTKGEQPQVQIVNGNGGGEANAARKR